MILDKFLPYVNKTIINVQKINDTVIIIVFDNLDYLLFKYNKNSDKIVNIDFNDLPELLKERVREIIRY